MKINVDFTPLEMASEEMEGHRPAAKCEAVAVFAKYGTDYEIKEVVQ